MQSQTAMRIGAPARHRTLWSKHLLHFHHRETAEPPLRERCPCLAWPKWPAAVSDWSARHRYHEASRVRTSKHSRNKTRSEILTIKSWGFLGPSWGLELQVGAFKQIQIGLQTKIDGTNNALNWFRKCTIPFCLLYIKVVSEYPIKSVYARQ